jgi:hypothetical protein
MRHRSIALIVATALLAVGLRGVLLVELRRIQRPTCGGLIRFTAPATEEISRP